MEKKIEAIETDSYNISDNERIIFLASNIMILNGKYWIDFTVETERRIKDINLIFNDEKKAIRRLGVLAKIAKKHKALIDKIEVDNSISSAV